MASDYGTVDGGGHGGQGGRGWLGWVVLVLVVFAAGAAAMGYALTHWPLARRYIAGTETTQAAPVAVVAGTPGVTMPPPAATDPAQAEALDARIAGLEGRMSQISARANAAVGNADRAEGLLVAFAARRALDRGVALGYIEALLRERFGGSQPQAVATVIAAAQAPVTLEELRAGLGEAGAALAGGGPDEGWLDGLRRELASLVVVRRANVPSPDPQDRLARARRQIEAGHVGAALAEVARMPGREAAAGWIASARRYAAARDALDVIETAALLEPRGLRAPPPASDPAPVAPSAPGTATDTAIGRVQS